MRVRRVRKSVSWGELLSVAVSFLCFVADLAPNKVAGQAIRETFKLIDPRLSSCPNLGNSRGME